MSDIHIISLGAGVQSSAMALMAAAGELTPMPAAAIFADTQAEPASVYRWLNWLETQLPFPVLRVTRGDLSADAVRVRRSRTGTTYLKPALPVFTVQRVESEWLPLLPDWPAAALEPKVGRLSRQCTEDYKIVVIQKEARRLMLASAASAVTMWIGISTDEADRAKPAMRRKKASRADAVKYRVAPGASIKIPHPFIRNRHPLLEVGLDRDGCLRRAPGAPRSACRQCPFRSDESWQRLKMQEPEEFEAAARWEDSLRASAHKATAIKADDVFLHRSLTPLREIDFARLTGGEGQFTNECEGVCGV